MPKIRDDVVSDGVSIPVDTWFGRPHRSGYLGTILRAGPAVWCRAIHEFVALGLLRDWQLRVMSTKPTGLELYGLVASMLRGLLPDRPVPSHRTIM